MSATTEAGPGALRTYFDELGTTVDRRWLRAKRRADALPEIAADALTQLAVPPGIGTEAVLAHLAAGIDLPKQRSSSDNFGQPPTVMFRAEGLEIQALTWLEGTTSIHQHGFDGAFKVLVGSSLHVRYGFDRDEQLAQGHLVVGELDMKSAEILRTGDVRPIPSGSDFIHALFHLERPSVTIVVRNLWSDLADPQYDYRSPGFGFDALEKDDLFAIRMRGLHTLYRLDKDEARRVALDAVRREDLWSAFRVTDYWFRSVGETDGFADLVEALAHKDDSLAPLLDAMYEEEHRRSRLLLRRGMLKEKHHRTLLALLVNLPDRTSIRTVLRQLHPDEDPDELIVRWIRELASPELRGVSGLSLRPEELDEMSARLSSASDPITALSERWRPPTLIEKLFV